MTDRELNIRIRTDGARTAASEIEDVAEVAEDVDERDWVAKIRADIADGRERIREIADTLDEVDGKQARATVDVDVLGDPEKVRQLKDTLGELPGDAGRAGQAMGDAFTTAGGVIGTATAGVGLAMAAWKIHVDRAREHAEEAKRLMGEMAGATDRELIELTANTILRNALAGRSIEETMTELAQSHLPSARRLDELMTRTGDTRFQGELRGAIREEERRQRQRRATEEQYGSDPFDHLPDVAPRGRASGGGGNVIIVNPPGTPPSINDAFTRYRDRNGDRRLP